MNINRRRNIFTLGDYQVSMSPRQQVQAEFHRKKNHDPFERDPFKVQSYNFRYAERPVYAIGSAIASVKPINPGSVVPHVDSVYYARIPSTASKYGGSNKENRESQNTERFQEYRRRKFLQDSRLPNPINNALQSKIAYNTGRSMLDNCSMYCHAGTSQSCSKASLRADSIARQDSMQSLRSTHSQSNQSVCSNLSNARSSSNYLIKSRSVTNSIRSIKDTPIANIINAATNSNKIIGSYSTISLQNSIRSQSRTNASQSSTLYNNSKSMRDSSSVRSVSIKSTQTKTAASKSIVPSDMSLDKMKTVSSRARRSPSTGSGCEINIHIKGFHDQSECENVTINIETDPVLRNLDISSQNKKMDKLLPKNLPINIPHSGIQLNLTKSDSAQTFKLDRNLSKYSLTDDSAVKRQNTYDNLKDYDKLLLKQKQKQRQREQLNAMVLNRAIDRMPSMMNWTNQQNNANANRNQSAKSTDLSLLRHSSNTRCGSDLGPSCSSATPQKVKSFLDRIRENFKNSLNEKTTATRRSMTPKRNLPSSSSQHRQCGSSGGVHSNSNNECVDSRSVRSGRESNNHSTTTIRSSPLVNLKSDHSLNSVYSLSHQRPMIASLHNIPTGAGNSLPLDSKSRASGASYDAGKSPYDCKRRKL